MGIRLTLTSDLFRDNREQEVIVRDQLPIQRLIAEISREYDLPEMDYALKRRDTAERLNPALTLEQAGVQMGDLLFFEVFRPMPTSTGVGQYPVLITPNNHIFEIRRNPALIGRPDPARHLHAALLDVDLTPLDPDKTTSRPHARIVERDGQFYLESDRDDNPALVNDHAVQIGTSALIKDGDQLRFGAVVLTFRIQV